MNWKIFSPTSSLSHYFHLRSSSKGVFDVQSIEVLNTDNDTMKLNKGSINSLGASKSNNSPKHNVTSSLAKKRKFGKNDNGWFNSKSFFFGLGIYIAFVASMFSHYWPANLQNDSSQDEVITWMDGFTLPCPIKSKEAISAINRTTSDYCKQRIAELACRSSDAPDGIGNLYATHLPNFCPPESIVRHNIPGPGLLEWANEWTFESGKHLFKDNRY